MAYPVVNQSNRGLAIYLLDILSLRRVRVSYVRGRGYLVERGLTFR